MLIPVIALAIPGVRADSLFAQTSGSVSADLMVRESGPDFQLCWLPSVATGKPPVYLVFLRPPGESSWFYFDYTENTCFVHYGASLFYPGMNYEVHAYFGSVRDLPGYPRDPQDPRLPGEAIRSF
ncbi:MAG: hypothetical protein FJY66_04200, partial [Calditrichaeota bacterium]|nr:hypothetical protein [Calditrichota bacterium]